MDPRHLLSVLVLTVACTDSKVHTGDDENPDDSTPSGGTDDSGKEAYEPDCPAPGPSACGNEASVLRGTVRLAPALTPKNTSGDLFIALAHEAYGGGKGGGYHFHTIENGVDLAAGPVPFELDMCAGGEMWTEENCTYGLVVVLDGNGNNGPHLFLPDEGEPAARVPELTVSCTGESPCLDVVLDCVDGDTCVSFAEQTCTCADETCNSDFALCI
jgi:hypothetical protein